MGSKKIRRAAVAVAVAAAMIVGPVGPATAGPRDTICYYMPPWCSDSTSVWWWPW